MKHRSVNSTGEMYRIIHFEIHFSKVKNKRSFLLGFIGRFGIHRAVRIHFSKSNKPRVSINYRLISNTLYKVMGQK